MFKRASQKIKAAGSRLSDIGIKTNSAERLYGQLSQIAFFQLPIG